MPKIIAQANNMLTARVANVDSLMNDQLSDMYTLFARYYDATSYARFVRDLSGKNLALLLFDEFGVIRGFTTLQISRAEFRGADIRVVFSGDTIVERAFWGSHALAFAWLRNMGRVFAAEPAIPMVWLLTVKGHRTYRYLPTFGLEFTPDWRRADDPDLVALKDALAAERFGSAYNSATGIVRFPQSEGHLAASWALPDERERARADIRFFLEKNPGYTQGDELVCLCRISKDNMRPLAMRVFESGVSG